MESAALLTEIGLPAALFLIMIGMGLSLTPKDFRQVLVAPKASLFGLVVSVLVFPLIAFALAWGLRLDPAMAVGLVIIAACPGGTVSNIFTYLGGGDLALSVVLTVMASLLTIATLPLYTTLALDVFQGTAEVIALPAEKTMATLLAIIIIPLMIGMGLRYRFPALAQRAEKLVGLCGLLVLVGVTAAIIVSLGDRMVTLLQQGFVAAVLLNFAGILAGYWGSRWLKLPLRQAYTVAVEMALKNATLGLMVTYSILQSYEMSVPSAVYGVLMFAFGAGLVVFGRRRGLGSVEETLTDPNNHGA